LELFLYLIKFLSKILIAFGKLCKICYHLFFEWLNLLLLFLLLWLRYYLLLLHWLRYLSIFLLVCICLSNLL